MIRTTDLMKVYQTDSIETTALNKVNIEIKEGEFVSIIGPSGCGKTTLLNIIGLLDQPTGGQLFFENTDITGYSEYKRTELRMSKIGFIFQSFNLIDELTVFENVELPYLYMKTPGHIRQKRVNEILDRLQIAHRRKHYPQQLSGGQQQRVAVARAVVIDPRMILADEPTGNLDSKNGDEVMGILSDLNKSGTTIVMVTHSPAHSRYAGREIHLLDGKVINGSIENEI